MSLVNYLKKRISRGTNAATANLAKERLQIIVAHERIQRRAGTVNLQELQLKLIEIIAEYLHIDRDQVNVELQRDENRSVLELNVTLPDRSAQISAGDIGTVRQGETVL
jgi:cell division topological specificity factor